MISAFFEMFFAINAVGESYNQGNCAQDPKVDCAVALFFYSGRIGA